MKESYCPSSGAPSDAMSLFRECPKENYHHLNKSPGQSAAKNWAPANSASHSRSSDIELLARPQKPPKQRHIPVLATFRGWLGADLSSQLVDAHAHPDWLRLQHYSEGLVYPGAHSPSQFHYIFAGGRPAIGQGKGVLSG